MLITGQLEKLKIKKMAKPPLKVNVRPKKGVTGVNSSPPSDFDDFLQDFEKVNLTEDTQKEKEKKEVVHKKQKVAIIDKRGEVNVNRNLILARLNQNTHFRVVEDKKKLTYRETDLIEQKKAEEYKVPIHDNSYIKSIGEIQKHPKKIKKTFTIQEELAQKMGEDMPEDKISEHEKIKQTIQQLENEVLHKELELKKAEDAEDAEDAKEAKEMPEKEKEVISDVKEEEADVETEVDPVEKQKKKRRTKAEIEADKLHKEKEKEEKKIQKEKEKAEKKNMTAKNKKQMAVDIEIDPSFKIGRKLLVNRLPHKIPFKVRTSAYYMNNRKIYIKKISELFAHYRKELLDTAGTASCDKREEVSFDLLTHQKVVRDYLNLYTPYRGLLLYHGLGSGKTCTSIAIAESMKTEKQIIIMTPKSLKMNFFTELKKCGDIMYKRNQYWEFVSTVGHPEYVPVLSKVLNIPLSIIEKNKGAWLVDVSKKEANFGELETSKQNEIDKQLDMMIESKYQYLNYKNGINQRVLTEITENFTVNPFDNKTILIDEAHNFIARIVNKLRTKQYKSISVKLYEYLLRASNVKIVFMTGTPIINYPSEIAVLFNILRGYIKKWTFNIRPSSTAPENMKLNHIEIMKIFNKGGLNTYDYVEYVGNKLTVTRNPYGFINTSSGKKGGDGVFHLDGGAMRKSKEGDTDTEDSEDEISNTLLNSGRLPDASIPIINKKKSAIHSKQKRKTIKVRRTSTGKSKSHTKSHTKRVRQTPESGFSVKNGLIYLHPKEEVDVPLEAQVDYNQRIHQDLYKGGAEIGGNASDPFVSYSGVVLDETGNISDVDFVNQIERILNKNHITILKTENKYEELKALPDTEEDFINMFISTSSGTIQNANVFRKRILGLVSYFRSAEESLLPDFIKTEKGNHYHIVNVEMSDYQFTSYIKIREKEEARERNKSKNQRNAQGKEGDNKDLFKVSSTYKIASRTCSNFAFPDPPGRPFKYEEGGIAFKSVNADIGEDDELEAEVEVDAGEEADTNTKLKTNQSKKTGGDDEVDEDDDQDQDEIQKMQKKAVAENYKKQIADALDYITYDETRPEETGFLLESNLGTYSNKFLKILQTLKDESNIGLHLLYSQFRTLEGVGIFKLVLEANGFAELKIRKNSSGTWEIIDYDLNADKPHFVLYTGTETEEEKEIIRNIYNSTWEYVPSSITSILRQKSENNFYGEIVKLCMITSSGTEGINLRNTRFVHIMESYWNMTRIEQTVGRARRICSHRDLPEELRNVKVFFYLSSFSQKQMTEAKEIYASSGISDYDPNNLPITTDQVLFNLASLKEKVNTNLLTMIKETAIDCNLFNPTNKQENIVCYGLGNVTTNDFISYPTLEQDRYEAIQLKETNPINGVVYAIDPKTLVLYDLESYKLANQGKGELVEVGKMVRKGPKGFVPEFNLF